MVVDVAAVHVVEVSFVQVVGVSFMADRHMAAAASVDVATMIRMFGTAHARTPLPSVNATTRQREGPLATN
jgi:hypothetical protein